MNLGNYYIVVNGTITARGTSTDKIQINGNGASSSSLPEGNTLAIPVQPAGITFNDYTRVGIGSVIENAVINNTEIALGNSDQLNQCTIIGSVGTGQSSTVSNSQVTGLIATGGTGQVLNNNVTGKIQTRGGHR